jgi:hypothetical protein
MKGPGVAITSYSGWIADGSPWKPAQPVADIAATLRRHGMTVYILGNEAHQSADPPEDHTAFSHTPWPGPQPYPHILACDIMPDDEVDWIRLGEQVVADKLAGVPGTEWIKYVNYTDRNGVCWHASWQPTYQRTRSTDRGHIHVSGRTDYVTSSIAAGYDPVARMRGEDTDMDANQAKQLADIHAFLFTDKFTGFATSQAGKKVTGATLVQDVWHMLRNGVPGVYLGRTLTEILEASKAVLSAEQLTAVEAAAERGAQTGATDALDEVHFEVTAVSTDTTQ